MNYGEGEQVATFEARTWYDQTVIDQTAVLIGGLIVLIALLGWRPAGQAPLVDSGPHRLIGLALAAAVLGVAVDWSGLFRFPIVATAASGGPSSSPALEYLVYLPKGYYRSFKRWPLLLYLHGSGAVKQDIARVMREGVPRRIARGYRFPFIVVAPQSQRLGWDVEALNALLDEVVAHYRVDPDRVYLTGFSMGATGLGIAAAYPNRFAAVAPVSGGGDPASAERLRDVPIWAFHGSDDRVVATSESKAMITALEQIGANATLTVYPNVAHDVSTPTYSDRRIYDWLLTHRRCPVSRE